jgi:monovalent cation:H+ antiporter-2, CPA2 family
MDAHHFLEVLTIVLGTAAVTTVLFQRLRQPVVLGYILAGFIIGPNVPVPLVADREVVQTLSELGVILLMFSLGLEFRLGTLVKLLPTAGLTALLQSSLMVWLGFICGRLFGWSNIESLFAGAVIAISSTTIIAKAFDEQGIKGPLRELVVGILIVEDLIAILLMATLTAVASGSGLSAYGMALTTGRLALFLVSLMGVGLLVVPRAVRAVVKIGRPETTLVASVGFCFGVSLLAHELGYSVALGAFAAGSLIAESGEQQKIEHLVQPVRDVFAAIFFVSVGVLIDPALLAQHWLAITVFTLLVVVGKVVGVALGAFLTGNGVRTSIQAGMSLAQIGEFSFIIAGLGLSLKATGDFLYPVAVAVSALTTLTTPWLIRSSGSVANLLDRKMPRALQTFFALYGSWLEQLRSGSRAETRGSEIRRLIRLLILDAALLAGVAIGTALAMDRAAGWLEQELGLVRSVARIALVATSLVLVLPLVAGVVRVARRLGVSIAEAALPDIDEATDSVGAPRRALVLALQLTVVLATGLPLLALTQPFLGGVYAPALLGLLLAALGVAFWRGASDLQGHVRAGAQSIVEAIVEQARAGGVAAEPAPQTGGSLAHSKKVQELLAGLGGPSFVHLAVTSPAVGRSLAALNLRGMTGATVLAMTRGEDGFSVPTAREVLRAGDVLTLAGTRDAIVAARELLLGEAAPERSATV